jgi:aminopeptidase N
MRGLLIAAAVLGALAAPASAHAIDRPSPGAAGIGDRLFPTLGNGGYDVQHYDLDLRYATSAPSQGIDGTVTILATATQSLSRFDLDFAGDRVGSVSVNGLPAKFSRVGEDLVIAPRLPLLKGLPFIVQVSHYTAHPTIPDPSNILAAPFFITPDGSATSGQPAGTHVFLPSNDHPRDKASFTIRFDVPAGEPAFANGVLLSKSTSRGRTHYVYLERQPMATELIQLAVGDYTTIDRGFHDGFPVRDVVAPSLAGLLADKLPTELGHLDWLQARVGRYPFDIYGSFVVDELLGFALETQTISLYDRGWFDGTYGPGIGTWEPTMVHEMAHMWFGDSVSPYEWSDVWQNEGHATWYQWTFAAEHGELLENAGISDDLDETFQFVYSLGDIYRAVLGPVAMPLDNTVNHLFSQQQYFGGALVLYALRQKVGDATFQRIERAWVDRYEGESPSTADFIALAVQVSRDASVGPFLHDWLYGTTTPAMPGHPDWTVTPVAAANTLRAQATPAELKLFPKR